MADAEGPGASNVEIGPGHDPLVPDQGQLAPHPALPRDPDRDMALRALGYLKDLISTFPFVTEADRAVALSVILTALVRRSLPTAPLHGFNAPTAGSGKSMSFHYNTGGIATAALTRHLNAGDRVAAADAFLNWRRPASIIPRRESERDLFRHGRYPGGSIPVWSVDRNGRVDFSRPIRRLTEAEALTLTRPQSVPVPTVAPTPDVPACILARLAALFASLTRRA